MRPVLAKKGSSGGSGATSGSRKGPSGGAGATRPSGRRGSRWLIAAGRAALGVVGLARWNGPASAQDGPLAALPARPAKVAEGPSRPAAPLVASGGALSTPEAPLPRSLEGTEMDGRLEVDPTGHLVVGPQVIALFDYFFAATGEESEAAIRERIRPYSRGHLTEPALGETLTLRDRYVAYVGSAAGLRADSTK